MGHDGVFGQHLLDMCRDDAHVDLTRLRRRDKRSEIIGTRPAAPFRPALAFRQHHVGKRRRHGIGSGMDGKVRRVDLADLVIRGVAVDQLGRHARRVEQRVAVGRRLAEPDVQRQDEVRVAKKRFHIAVHRHAGIADI